MASVLLAFVLWLFATRKFNDWLNVVFPGFAQQGAWDATFKTGNRGIAD